MPSWRLVFKHHYSGGNSEYFAVAAAGRGTAFAVGGANFAGPTGGVPVTARWHDGRWTALAMPRGLTAILGAVSADSSNDAWTVSELSGDVLHWHNGRWKVARRFSENGTLTQELTGVTAFSPTNVWVFGGSGANPGFGTWHLHGGVWTRVRGSAATSPLPAPYRPETCGRSVASTSANGRWTRHALPTNYDPIDMVADGQGGLWFTAVHTSNSEIQFLHRSAQGRWRVMRDPGVYSLALIPGTRSLWGAGGAANETAFEAAIYAAGRIR